MCSFFLGEHIISFIFIMSSQQIFILDILRPRAAIFYKTLLSKRISDSQFVGFFFSSLYPPLPFSEVSERVGQRSLRRVYYLFCQGAERKQVPHLFMYLCVVFLLPVLTFSVSLSGDVLKQVPVQTCVVLLPCVRFPRAGSSSDTFCGTVVPG